VKKNLLFLACGFGLFVLAGSVLALPPCSWVDETACAGECLIYQQSCVSWSVGACSTETAPYTFQCSGGTIYGTCDCAGGTGGGCFLAGTEISLADGSTKPIESIEAGDVVMAWDMESGELKPDPVRAVQDPREVDSFLIVNDSLRVTPSHPFLSDGEWVKAGDLKVGDHLTAADGSVVTVATIETVPGPVTVYNFEVNPYGTYVANGIVVHNRSSIKDGTPDEP
jgi:hypothetical protein